MDMQNMDNLLLELNSTQEDSLIKKDVKVLPIGENIIGVDGRAFEIDGKEVYESLKNSPSDLMLDLNHQSDGEAMGWFKNPVLKNDGIYADLELTPKGRELVKNKAYRYLSPAFRATKDGVKRIVKSIHSVGLVNMPNLKGLALNNQQENSNQDERINMENELKDALEKIDSLSKEIQTFKSQNETLNNELNQLRADKEALEKNSRIEKIERAIAAKELLPSRKEELLELNNEELDKFLGIYKVEAANTLNASLELNSMQANPEPETELSVEIKKQLGL